MAITKKVEWPFDQYRWTWAGLMPQENLKKPSTYLSVLRVLMRYEGLPHTEGKIRDELISDLEALKIGNVAGSAMQMRRADGTSVLLRNDQVYWTTVGALLPTKLVDGNINITPLGKALALGRITLRNHAELMCKRMQLPNPAILDTEEKYEEWRSHGVHIHPLALMLKVLVCLHSKRGTSAAYVAEQELGAIIVPLAPTAEPEAIADAIINVREGTMSAAIFPSRSLIKDDGKELRTAREFLQYLSICSLLLSTEQTVNCIKANGTSEWCESGSVKARCYYLNTIGVERDSRFGELSDSDELLRRYGEIADEGLGSPFIEYRSGTIGEAGAEETYQGFRLRYCKFLGSFETTPWALSHVTDTSLAKMAESLRRKKQAILYGPPGTGKTRMAIEIKDLILGAGAKERSRMIQFHQNYSYDDFVEGIRPAVSREESSSSIAFLYKDGIFKQMCLEAMQDLDHEYVLIIDEINRGNMASIFGELILLLEDSYREPDSAVRLPYTGDYLYVPRNLYILGTMNSTDKTAIDLDLALRRRFHFIRLEPDMNVLERELASASAEEIELAGGAKVKPADVLRGLNGLIARDRNLGSDFRIGHSYFLPLMKNPSAGMLEELFGGEILPLLEEYLMHSPNLGASLREAGLLIEGSSIDAPGGEALSRVMVNLSQIAVGL